MTPESRLDHDWYPVSVPGNVRLGTGAWLYSSFAFLHYQSTRAGAVRVGRSSGIYNGSFFDLGPDGEVQIGDYSTLVGAIICSNGKIVIGDYVFIAHEVVLADHQIAMPFSGAAPEDAEAANPDNEHAGIFIGNDVWIGAGAIILSGAHIGTGAIVGASTVVDFKVPEYAVVAGNPARVIATQCAKP